MNNIERIFHAEGFRFNNEILQKFTQYMSLLLDWNKRLNLTAITEEDGVIYKHFLDSLLLLKSSGLDLVSGRLIDVGTGAGFPGVPIAICNPNLSVFLSDSLEKRVSFLKHLCETLKIENTAFLSGRAEDLAREPLLRESFDFATARAVSSLPVILEYLSPFVKPGGFVICYKGPGYQEELKMSEKAIQELSLELVSVENFNFHTIEMFRSILIFKKIEPISTRYPRRTGVPSKKPIL